MRSLSGTLERVVGIDDASGFISIVGQEVGTAINDDYRTALNTEKLSREEVAEVLVDLKRRINGDFRVVEQDDEKIVLENTRCPFGDKVLGRESLCMMTSNVFGVIAAENVGYGRVELQQAIARGDPGCRVVVHLRPGEAGVQAGREYFESGR